MGTVIRRNSLEFRGLEDATVDSGGFTLANIVEAVHHLCRGAYAFGVSLISFNWLILKWRLSTIGMWSNR